VNDNLKFFLLSLVNPGYPALGSWHQRLLAYNQVVRLSFFTFSSNCKNGLNKSMGMGKSVLDLP
jgi:hypothetical protein